MDTPEEELKGKEKIAEGKSSVEEEPSRQILTTVWIPLILHYVRHPKPLIKRHMYKQNKIK